LRSLYIEMQTEATVKSDDATSDLLVHRHEPS
jgi:hypothetical protein